MKTLNSLLEVRMRKPVLFPALMALVSLALLPVEARAQAMLRDKVIVQANVGIQVGDNDLSRQSTFDLYDEPATVDISQTINNGAFFEFGGAYKVRPAFGIGVVYGFVSNSGEGTISGSLPHPQFFDQPRSFQADASDLKHAEHSIHFQAIYYMPFTDKVDFSFFGGPSVFAVKQGLLQSVVFSENPPAFTSVTIDSVETVELKDSGWGFNIGADMTYALTPRIGVAGLVRYTRGTVDFNISEAQVAEVKTGGFQIGAGIRYKF
jgi:hypothetical protein